MPAWRRERSEAMQPAYHIPFFFSEAGINLKTYASLLSN